jgi:hypothetical protein
VLQQPHGQQLCWLTSGQACCSHQGQPGGLVGGGGVGVDIVSANQGMQRGQQQAGLIMSWVYMCLGGGGRSPANVLADIRSGILRSSGAAWGVGGVG